MSRDTDATRSAETEGLRSLRTGKPGPKASPEHDRGHSRDREIAALRDALEPLVAMYDHWLASDLNYEAAHHAFVGWQAKYDAWEKARKALKDTTHGQ
jgi:hypothetical protein